MSRFAGSLRPGPPAPSDEAWALAALNEGERRIWARMSNPDRRHAVAVARAVDRGLGPAAERPVVAAALLHDSGKVVSGLGTPARVVATLLWLVAPPGVAERWAGSSSTVRRRLGQYRLHPELGADALAAAGSDPLTVAWTREHHRPSSDWTLPPAVAAVLKACDDD